jgi:hypothetical protein
MCDSVSIKFSKDFADKTGVLEFNGSSKDVVDVVEMAMAYLETAPITRAGYARDLIIPDAPEGTDD